MNERGLSHITRTQTPSIETNKLLIQITPTAAVNAHEPVGDNQLLHHTHLHSYHQITTRHLQQSIKPEIVVTST